MSLAQQLLVRALVAAFWRRALRRSPPVRWGTTLARSLPAARTSCGTTSRTCSATSQRAGFPFDPDVVRARSSSFASRSLGTLEAAGDVALELRHAIEPWHVLGEEPSGRRHRALRRLVGRAGGGPGARHDRRPACRRLQRPPRSAASHRDQRRVRGRRSLPRLAAPLGAAPDHRRARAAGLRHLDRWTERLGRRAARTMWRIPGALATSNFPRNGLEAESRRSRASSALATPRESARPSGWSTIRSSRSRSILRRRFRSLRTGDRTCRENEPSDARLGSRSGPSSYRAGWPPAVPTRRARSRGEPRPPWRSCSRCWGRWGRASSGVAGTSPPPAARARRQLRRLRRSGRAGSALEPVADTGRHRRRDVVGIEEGLAQRARCSTRCSRSLRAAASADRGLFPPEFVWEHPGFLRPCAGLRAARALAAALRRPTSCAAGRRLRGARRPHAGPLGRGLCAGESHRALERRCRTLSASATSSAWRCSSAPCGTRCSARALQPR